MDKDKTRRGAPDDAVDPALVRLAEMLADVRDDVRDRHGMDVAVVDAQFIHDLECQLERAAYLLRKVDFDRAAPAQAAITLAKQFVELGLKSQLHNQIEVTDNEIIATRMHN